MKVTAQLYGQFLLSSQVNYTGTYLAHHVAGLTHDNVTRAYTKCSAELCSAPRGSTQRTRNGVPRYIPGRFAHVLEKMMRRAQPGEQGTIAAESGAA